MSTILLKYFLTYNDFKTINNSFSSIGHLSIFSNTAFSWRDNQTKKRKQDEQQPQPLKETET